MLAVVSCACSSPSGDVRPEAPLVVGAASIALVDHLDRAIWLPAVVNLNNPQIDTVRADLGDGSVTALFCHPQASLTWTLRLTTPVRLETAVGLLPEAWSRSGDGVGFRVVISDPDDSTLFRQVVDPRRDAGQRRWHPVSVDLSRWAGREIALTLATDAGPGHDPGWDWAVWRDPVLTPH